ncbi:MAG TPA: hypothetical protein PKE21_07435 [Flavobacteriales bacterium]|nr:hypothetical protein [Flavobacteriales bacterium]HMR27291.1 hypothetical protein [Flavobacteriales bacterium]
MEHTWTRPIGLAFALSLFTGVAALGQSAARFVPDSAQAVPVPTHHVPQGHGESNLEALVLWLAPGMADRVHRGSHPALRIRIGRSFTITVTKG